jgi:hypothetical protein
MVERFWAAAGKAVSSASARNRFLLIVVTRATGKQVAWWARRESKTRSKAQVETGRTLDGKMK